MTLERLAEAMVLGALLELLRPAGYELIAHWKQGEFHHDVVLRVPRAASLGLPGEVLVVATNCNGGIKEVLSFDRVPDRYALWHWRCPHVADFSGELPSILGTATTAHWFDPCELLAEDARSELKEEARERQLGGGFTMKGSCSKGS